MCAKYVDDKINFVQHKKYTIFCTNIIFGF